MKIIRSNIAKLPQTRPLTLHLKAPGFAHRQLTGDRLHGRDCGQHPGECAQVRAKTRLYTLVSKPLSESTSPAGSLSVEAGPSDAVTLQWATYYDAADQAGTSRIFGGIHITADDFAGRRLGSACGEDAWSLAQRYFAGDA